MPVPVKVAMGLFVAAEVAILAVVGWEGVWLAAAWGVGALVVASGVRAVRSSIARVSICAALVPLCVVLTFEGGLFFVPAAVALLLAAVLEWRGMRHMAL
jgi:hypothetical protein